jgi:hypothetical protein
MWIAVGLTGSDVSFDNGRSLKPFDTDAFNAVSFFSSKCGWAGATADLRDFD